MLQATAIAPATRALRIPSLALPLAIVVVLLLMLPMVLASPSHLTSDESLYQAEAYNIAEGRGFTYPSGDAITHRAPLYPLILAPAIKFGGLSAAYAVSKAIIIVNALLVMWLAWRLKGALAGMIAGTGVAASAYLAELGTTLYLDPAQCMLLLLALIGLHGGISSKRLQLFATSGALSGLAFLMKESAVQWAPLALVAVLMIPSLRNRDGLRAMIVFSGAFALATLPWWIWLYVETGHLFLLGELTVPRVAGATLLLVIACVAVVWIWRSPVGWQISSRVATALALAITALWGLFLLAGLTRFSSWPYPNDYLTQIPRYLWRVAPQRQPYFLIVSAWMWGS
jgi:4-amino-4-deoxy-L-arabinose transferase-like glycosyltransferase